MTAALIVQIRLALIVAEEIISTVYVNVSNKSSNQESAEESTHVYSLS